MKPLPSHVRAAAYEREQPLSARLLILAAIIALLFASLPFGRVSAAGEITIDFAEEWENKLLNLRTAGQFYDRIRLFPADFKDRDDLAAAHALLEKYGIALRQANTIVLNHTGFDSRGRVTNEIQAERSLKELAMYLHIMRGLRAKFEEQGYKYHLIR